MGFLVLGLNHNSAPLEVREKVAFSQSKIQASLRELIRYPFVEECLILSTCNRVEVYVISEDSQQALSSIRKFLTYHHNLKDWIAQYLYFYENQEAIRHLFRVVSSLDSMIVGENQIVSQVKQAYLDAVSAGTVDKQFHLIFQTALRVAKKVRTQTEIGKGAVSVSSAGVELAKKVLKGLEGKSILVIGAGKIGELTVRNLAQRGIRMVLVANRTYSRAVELARIFNGKAISFAQLPQALKEVDIVISSTSAPHCILRKKDVLPILRRRTCKPLFIIDLGVPRNVEQEISEIEGVYLYNIDDLEKISQLNRKERMKEALRAEEIVSREAEDFYARLEEVLFSQLELIPS